MTDETRDPSTLGDDELSLAVEREVFGATLVHFGDGSPGTLRPDDSLARPIPNYATDIAAAFSLWDRFWAFNLEKIDSVTPRYVATICGRDGSAYEAWHDRAPRAICEAALHAVRARNLGSR